MTATPCAEKTLVIAELTKLHERLGQLSITQYRTQRPLIAEEFVQRDDFDMLQSVLQEFWSHDTARSVQTNARLRLVFKTVERKRAEQSEIFITNHQRFGAFA